MSSRLFGRQPWSLACWVLLAAACTDAADAGAQHSTAEPASMAAQSDSVDWKAIEVAMGRPSVTQAGDVHRFNFPRGDLHVTVTSASGSVAISTAFALGGWIAFKATGDGIIAMGDLVLADDEINPVITALQAGGIEQTAIHHHLLHESPRVYYMHVHARGDAVKIAQAIGEAVALTGTPAPAPAAAPSAALDLDTLQVARVLGYPGRVNSGVYQVGVPRAEAVHEGPLEIPPSMGLGTAINFQPTGAGKAAITGDFVLLASEVNPVIRALRDNGIEVTSLHNHMLAEEPRLFFVHFWANDDAVRLARGLRAAIDQTNSRRPTS
jgi:Domain of Unknown Function (DUF1259)